MSEFLGNYGFFILIALVMVICHLGHGGYGGQAAGRTSGAKAVPHGGQDLLLPLGRVQGQLREDAEQVHGEVVGTG